MRHVIVLVLASVLASLIAACATPMAKITQTAKTRAAFDFSCPEASMQASGIGDTTRIGATPQSPGVERTVVGVTGCDQKAVYVVECVTGACNAMLNANVAGDADEVANDGDEVAPPPAPAPAPAP